MTFLDRLEGRFARFAVPGLIRYVVALNALVFLLLLGSPQFASVLILDREAILQGQVWRLVSWIFLPETTSFLFILFYLFFTWQLGDMLEATWGTFRLNVYYLLGMLGVVVAALLFGPALAGVTLNLTLLLAVATLAPELEIYLFGIVPLKLKWVAILSLLVPGYYFFFGGVGTKVATVLCLGNYLLFFGPGFFRRGRERRQVAQRRARFEAASEPVASLHRCELCGMTEVSNPHADFRVARDGREYCTDHLPPAV